MSTNTVIIDDRDPLVSYTGAWSQGGASLEFDQTTSFSVSAGSTAMITFVGTSVTVYGTVAAKNLSPQASWSFAVDNSIAGTYTPPNNMTSDIHHEALWTSPSPALSNSSHTLVINQTSAASAGVIYLDYIISSASSSASSTASSTDSASNTPAPHKKTPIGAIVGPIVGVLVLVALVAAIFVCLRRRRREKSEYPDREPCRYIHSDPNR
ncbi:hypothetical protein B0H19DRAFT_924775 [Mycena capillaripes]|nr:hypothetical protein B0H19DRAFT_924775 [Mycena capillaripes]